ncbi:MAG: exo-alpha-sialidase [Bryobacterales bacterium]|nr:exo-alpha-sialidase [Bryobacterales bacterium]
MLSRRSFLLAAALRPDIDAKQDRTTLIYEGRSPNKLCCDTTLRRMPDGTWVMLMLGGGDTEPLPENDLFLTRSRDEGRTWGPMEPIDLGIKRRHPHRALVPTELMVYRGECRLFFANHNGKFADWTAWYTVSRDACRTWSAPHPLPEKIHRSTFTRNHIVRRNGEIVIPFQHYLNPNGPIDPRNGVMISRDRLRTFELHGWIGLSNDANYRGFAENNVVELEDGRMVMIIRADRLGGVLYQAESCDGGRTWSDAVPTDIPNPGSKATIYHLRKNTVAMLHNPNAKARNPLSLWVSFDGMRTWPYRRDLVTSPGRLNYPDGFLSKDRRFLHFAFDDNRHKAVYYGARLPEAR